MPWKPFAVPLFVVALSAYGPPSAAQQGAPELAPVVVTGNAPLPSKTQLSSEVAADPASVTVLDLPEQEKRNLQTYGDILRPVTGVTVDNYGQGGLGYGIALRGFPDSEHGRDVASFIDGVPINQVSSLQTYGYTDLNLLIPELLGRVELVRGPFTVRAGDFSYGGSVFYTTAAQPAPGLYLSGGNFGTGRALGAYSFAAGPLNGYASLDAETTSGYRDNQDFKRINSFDKLFFHALGGTASVRFQVYSSDFDAPGYLDRSLLLAGKLSPQSAVNQIDGGSVAQQNVVLTYRQDDTEEPISATAYLLHNAFKRWATFNLVPQSADAPGQALQYDNRVQTGASLEKYFRWTLPYGMAADLLLGAGDRSDFVRARQDDTLHRDPVDQTQSVDFDQHDLFGCFQPDLKPLRWLKLTGGIRYDHFFFEIDDRTNRRAVSPNTGVASPKAGIAIMPLSGLAFYANVGQSFRSPTAVNGELSLDPGLKPSKMTSTEVGLQYDSPNRAWHFLFDAYRTRLQNEIEENAPPEPPTSLGPSTRNGFDVEGGWTWVTPEGWKAFTLFANFSAVSTDLLGRKGGNEVPNVPDYLLTCGVDAVLPLFSRDSPHVLGLTVYHQWIGPKPIVPDRSESTRTYTRLTIDLNYTNKRWKGASAFCGFVVYPDRRYEESDFDFGSGKVGVDPKAPVKVRGGIYVPL